MTNHTNSNVFVHGQEDLAITDLCSQSGDESSIDSSSGKVDNRLAYFSIQSAVFETISFIRSFDGGVLLQVNTI